MNIYENIVILNAALSDEDINVSISKIKDAVTGSGGEIVKTDMWGRRKLAYEIKKQNKGFYVLFVFKTPPSTIKKLEELYKVFDPVIKYMVIKLGTKQAKHVETAIAAAAAAAEVAAKASSEAEQAKKEV